LKRLLELFFFLLSLCLAPFLEDLRVLLIFEEKITSFLDAYSGVELCTPMWLNHDYGEGGVVDILLLDAYSRVDVCTPIFMGEASN
jgi:hypothetical protein